MCVLQKAFLCGMCFGCVVADTEVDFFESGFQNASLTESGQCSFANIKWAFALLCSYHVLFVFPAKSFKDLQFSPFAAAMPSSLGLALWSGLGELLIQGTARFHVAWRETGFAGLLGMLLMGTRTFINRLCQLHFAQTNPVLAAGVGAITIPSFAIVNHLMGYVDGLSLKKVGSIVMIFAFQSVMFWWQFSENGNEVHSMFSVSPQIGSGIYVVVSIGVLLTAPLIYNTFGGPGCAPKASGFCIPSTVFLTGSGLAASIEFVCALMYTLDQAESARHWNILFGSSLWPWALMLAVGAASTAGLNGFFMCRNQCGETFCQILDSTSNFVLLPITYVTGQLQASGVAQTVVGVASVMLYMWDDLQSA